MVHWRTDLPLPTFFLDGDFLIDLPIEAFAFLVTFDESVVLAEVVSHT
jgi:hypothetical protein